MNTLEMRAAQGHLATRREPAKEVDVSTRGIRWI